MRYLFVLTLFCLVEWSNSKRCPFQYKRFTSEHSFCLKKNKECDIKRSRVHPEDIETILRLHNEFRSGIALGKEHRAIGGSLPKAADMMQMVWDEELARVAEKWAENCQLHHDCQNCRAVENFDVGQNLAIGKAECPEGGCREDVTKPDWTKAITGLYEEVLNYHIEWLGSYEDHPGPITGHFTQVIWSKSWRVGCGYAAFKESENVYRNFYVCNYGPGGNIQGAPVYKEGEPCSACPINSCCGSSCSGGPNYQGLCQILDPNTSPEYQIPPNLFYCGGSFNDKDCQAFVTGADKWRMVHSVGGNYNSIVLNGGESTTVSFNKEIMPKKDSTCFLLNFRKGPLKATREDSSSLILHIKSEFAIIPPITLKTSAPNFENYRRFSPLPEESGTKLSFTFSVPKGAGKHVLDFRKISVNAGQCV